MVPFFYDLMQLRILAGSDAWVKGLCSNLSARIKVLGIKSVEKSGDVAHFVDITTKDVAPGAIQDSLSNSVSVLSTELTNVSDGHLMGVVIAKDCKVCNSLINSDSASFISSAATEADCSMGYKIFLNSEGVPILLNRLSKQRVSYKVEEISPISADYRLTPRQLTILKSAMEMGLYDFPRRITQDELAARIGITPSTLTEILRRAEKKILGDFLGEKLVIEG
jgi:predicted DNA binding protein